MKSEKRRAKFKIALEIAHLKELYPGDKEAEKKIRKLRKELNTMDNHNPDKHKKNKNFDADKYMELYKKGYSIRKMTPILKLGRETISVRAKRLNLPIPKTNGKRKVEK